MSVNFSSIANLRASGAGSDVVGAIRDASARTGVDESYLLAQARLESGMNPDAKASTSSATGLYQFIDQTWLATVKRHGAKHGLGWAADSITAGPGGRLSAGHAERDILDLRKDPAAASAMAAEFASDNQDYLEQRLGRPVGQTDLYMAHFLGAAGAANFLSGMADNPEQPAATLLPAAARANRPVFYQQSGEARSVREVYERFAEKLGRSGDMPARTMLARQESPTAHRALEATRQWVAMQRGTAGDAAPPSITPSTARLLYLSLTTGQV